MTSTARADSTKPAESAPPALDPVPAPSPAGRLPARLAAAVRRPAGVDSAVAALFVLFAAFLTAGLWPDPSTRVLALNPEDQTLYEWFLANDARILFGDFSLVTDRLNAPEGVNLMANTTVIALGALLAPVTLLFGAETTFALIAALNLALTATAWYLLFARVLRAHRFAAAIGGAFCGFAPGMVSQNNSHLHMTAQWLVPLIVWCVVGMLRAADPATADNRRLLRFSFLLAAVVTVQVFIGEEVLFLTAVTLTIMTIAYAVVRRRFARAVLPRFAAGMLVAAAAAVLALVYPLWLQFAGPQSVPNGVFSASYFSADLASWPAISPMSLAGTEEAAELTTGPAEYNTFLGWPLLIATAGCAIWLWRRPLVVACVVAGAAMAALSLGPDVVVRGERTPVPGPYVVLHGLPVVDGALPMRFALAVIPLIAVILVVAVDRALRDRDRIVRIAVPVAVVAALLPIAPTPMPTEDRPPVPRFIAAGHWRDCVRPGGVLVPVPLPTPGDPWPMRWAAATTADFALPEGFFIGPYGEGGRGSMGTSKEPTSSLLDSVVKTGKPAAVDAARRERAREDLAFWGASCVVLADGAPHQGALLETLRALLGSGTRVADAWTWRVG